MAGLLRDNALCLVKFSLFDPELLKPALINAVLKLDPRAQWHNPVMMVVWCCCVLLTIVSGVQLAAHSSSEAFLADRCDGVAVVHSAVCQYG